MTARVLPAACLLCATLAAPSAAQLRGEPDALAAVKRLLDAMGGAEVWARGRTIRIQLRGYLSREQDVWNETYWIDLEQPRGRYEIRSGDTMRVIAWTAERGWEQRGDGLEVYDQDRLDFERAYWAREPNVVFRRLGGEMPTTRVALDSTDAGLPRLTVFDGESGEMLCWFALDVEGRPVKWSATLGERVFEHVLGPVTDFDGVRLPAWGGTIGGMWRYEHVTAALSPDPPTVSFDSPTRP